MNTKHISIANPYNDKHIMMFNEFEQGNNIVNTTSEYLKDTRRNLSEDEYNKECKESNEIKQSLFITDKNEIIDSCHIQGEKDIRTCTLFFAPIKTLKKRPIIEQTMDYAFSVLGMEEVFVSTAPEEKSLQTNLEKLGFENIGDNNGSITFIKEKEEQVEMERVM